MRAHPSPVLAKFQDFSDDDGGDDDNGGGTGFGPGTGTGPGLPGGPGAPVGGMLPGNGGGSGDDDESVAKSMLLDYNEKFAGADPALHRDEVIDRVMAALISKNKPSAVMLGPAGVGKTRVVEEIARRIAGSDPTVPPRLRDKTVYELSLTSLMSGTMYRGMMEAKLEALIRWAGDPANGAILFIDEIHQLVPADGHGNGSMEEIAQALKPALARGEISVIGATTDQEGRRLVGDPAFMRRFTRVGVSELNQQQTVEILTAVVPGLETHYAGDVVCDPSLYTEVVAVADEHLRTLHRPDSALTLIDRAMARLAVDRHKPLFAAAVTGPLQINRALLRQTAEGMHGSDAVARGFDPALLRQALTRVKGQDSICDEIVVRLRRKAAGLFPSTAPLAWIFAGPSGGGKTQAAKEVAAQIMGTAPIILNMAEFSEPYSITRLVGSSPGYIGSDSNKEMPFDPLDANPRQVIVFDELEKAHRDVQRLLLAVLEEGQLKMSSGKVVDFSKAIIIATTNAGRDQMAAHRRGLGFSRTDPADRPPMSPAELTKALTSGSSASNGFEPELLGRFSWIVEFSSIDRSVYREIVVAAYDRLLATVAASNPLQAAKLPQVLPDDDADRFVEQTYVHELGARPAEKAVREWIEELCDR